MSANDNPPPSVVTVYDDTHRGTRYLNPAIMSMANYPNLLGNLEHYSPNTDGSFAICLAGGEGVFITKALLESIPAEHRPELNTADAGMSIGSMKSLGSVLFPFTLTDAESNERIRLVLYTIVVPELHMGMFIGRSIDFWYGEYGYFGNMTYNFNFGVGGIRKVRGIERRKDIGFGP